MNVKHLPPRNGADLAPGPVHVYVWERPGSTYFKVSPFRNTVWYVPIPPRNYFSVTLYGHFLLINKGFIGPKAPFFIILRRIRSIHVTSHTITLVGDGYLVFDVSRIVPRRVLVRTYLQSLEFTTHLLWSWMAGPGKRTSDPLRPSW